MKGIKEAFIDAGEISQIGIPEPHNSPDVNVIRVGESMTDVTDKSEFVETRETEPVDKAGWIIRRISELGGYENVDDSAKEISESCAQAKDRREYKKITKNIAQLIKWKGNDTAKSLIEELMQRYPRKPALLDELEKVEKKL